MFLIIVTKGVAMSDNTSPIKELNADNYQRELAQTSGPVLLDFWAE